MTTDPSNHRCPRCGAAIPAEAPQGLCPACLLAGVAQGTETVATFTTPGQLAARGAPTIAEVAAAFPQFEILECIGQGGMGVVYKARQPKLDRLVALKLLPHFAAADAGFRERFTREARLLARLNHPNIVTVFDFGDAGGFFYLLMEYVDGANLRQAMRAGRFTPAQALEIVPKICDALQYAHSEGVLHRDIKPENILLDLKGRVKIADFGIAKLAGQRESGDTLTATGAAVGTPQYMAPEQLERPREVDHRADIYSLGVVFYEMLTGELPLGRFAPPSAKTPVDERVDAVVFRTLEKEREKRFQSAGEVKTEVEGLATAAAAGRGEPARGGNATEASAFRTTGTPAPGRTATAAAPPSARLKPEHRPFAIATLLAVLAILIPQVMPVPALLFSALPAVTRNDPWAGAVSLMGVALGAALVWLAWRHRARLLEPFRAAEETDEADHGTAKAEGSRWLERLALVVLMVFAVHVASMVIALTVAMVGRLPGVIVIAALGATVWLTRRWESRLESGPVTSGPAWQSRVGWLLIGLALVGCWPWFRPSPEGVRQFVWPLLPLIGLTGAALLLRSRAWRAVALGVNVVVMVGLVIQLVVLFTMLARHAVPTVSIEGAQFGGMPMVSAMALAEGLPFLAGLMVLRRRDVMRSFGLEHGGVAPGVAAAAGLGATRISGKAVAALLMVGLSGLLTLAMVGLTVLASRSHGSMGLGVGEVWFGLGVLGLGVVGTVLGLVAWIEIRRSGGALSGKPLAVLATFLWPVLLFVLVPLSLLTVFGLRTSRAELPRPALLAGAPEVDKGELLAGMDFQLHGGQVAMFELVTLIGDRPEPLGGYALYAVAGETAIEGRVRIERCLRPGNEGPRAAWRFLVAATGDREVVQTSDAPLDLSGLKTVATLQEQIAPNSESVHWLVRDDRPGRSLGLRVRTCAHRPVVGTAGSAWLGAGTNWTEYLSSPR